MGLLTGKSDPIASMPGYNATSEAWVEWHKTLKNNFGKKIANQLWVKAWGIRGSKSNASDYALREYMKSQGVQITETAWDKVVDLGGGAADLVGDFFQYSKIGAYAIAFILLGGTALVIWNIAGKGDIINKTGQAAGVAGKTFLK